MKKLVRIGKIIILAVAFIVVAFPFFWCLMLSFKSNAEIMSIPTTFFPSEWIVSGYKKVLTEAPFMTWLWNSLFSSVVSTAIVVFTSCLGGYIFGKFNFKGKNLLFLLFLATMMIPFQVIMVPLYLEVYYLKWLNTYWGLIIPKVASAYWIFLCRAAFQELPKELEDAARIDGLGEFGIFWKIMLPLVKPTMITMLLLGINNCWNDLLWPLIVANASTMRTLSNGLAIFIGDRTSEYSLAFTAAAVSMLPMLVLYIFGQKYFVAGQVSSGIKG